MGWKFSRAKPDGIDVLVATGTAGFCGEKLHGHRFDIHAHFLIPTKYIGVRSHEPILRDVLSEATARDGAVREDDSIEILLDTNHDQKSFHHFAVKPEGVLYDANARTRPGTAARVATAREEKKRAWTAEIAIPLKEVGADLAAHPTWGFQMTRYRPCFNEC